MSDAPYSADRSLYGKLRRRLARMVHTRPARLDVRRPLITISFDDAPASAATTGAAILERHGVRGTYFISAGLMNTESHLGRFAGPDEIRALHAAGHEIACHTFSHFDCGRGSGADIVRELDENRAALKALGLPEATTFAYPYGDVSPQAKAVLDTRFNASRALHHGLITTGSDLNQTPAVGIEGADGEQAARDWLQRAQAEKAWLGLYTHDVRESPSSWGCTPEVLERVVIKAREMGFDFVTYAEGAAVASGQAFTRHAA